MGIGEGRGGVISIKCSKKMLVANSVIETAVFYLLFEPIRIVIVKKM